MPEYGDVEPFREFSRELLLRLDRTTREFAQRTDEMRAENRAMRAETRAYFERIDRKLDEVIAEGRAQRAALLRMLDRLDGNGGTAPA